MPLYQWQPRLGAWCYQGIRRLSISPILRNCWREFLQIWLKNPLGVKDEMIWFWGSKVKVTMNSQNTFMAVTKEYNIYDINTPLYYLICKDFSIPEWYYEGTSYHFYYGIHVLRQKPDVPVNSVLFSFFLGLHAVLIGVSLIRLHINQLSCFLCKIPSGQKHCIDGYTWYCIHPVITVSPMSNRHYSPSPTKMNPYFSFAASCIMLRVLRYTCYIMWGHTAEGERLSRLYRGEVWVRGGRAQCPPVV